MYYCSIEDAWGNNFNNEYFDYKQNNIQETITSTVKDKLPNDEKIPLKDKKIDNSDLMENKKISLEKEIEKTIEKIYEMKNKKKKLLKKTKKIKNKNNIN